MPRYSVTHSKLVRMETQTYVDAEHPDDAEELFWDLLDGDPENRPKYTVCKTIDSDTWVHEVK